ncbi:MAG: helicase C-terminal domain-containing protein [Pseudomonadales bacterium]|nr:helicase C-terminal domain-containing protein [Pseudomonadales bacterium]
MRGRSFSVRQLAEFFFRRGDLYQSRVGLAVEAEDGVRVQREVQNQRLLLYPGYIRERAFKYQAQFALNLPQGIDQRTISISGRADGLLEVESNLRIEEFKTCGLLPELADPVDCGQLYLYGCLLAAEQVAREHKLIELHLVYVDVQSLQEREFTWIKTPGELLDDLSWLLALLAASCQRQAQHVAQRDVWIDTLDFPLPNFRPGQQAMARRVYQAVRSRANLMLEAPTGSGKSLGVLFPTVRALQGDEQMFFLTGRNAGREAAFNALSLIDQTSQHLLAVDITAKEKICFVEGMPCDPALCKYASGYFDKIASALDTAAQVMHCDRETIEAIALDHEVCPFELSLDMALRADLVVGDYNYIFDPVVRLKRFMNHPDMHLLTDEAHQLLPRAQDMLTVKLSRKSVRKAKSISRTDIRARVNSVDRAFVKYRRGLPDGEHELAALASVDRAAARLVETVVKLEIDLADYPELQDLYFDCLRWCRAQDWLGKGEFFCRITIDDRDGELGYVCIDPSPYLTEVSAEYASNIRFSATLSPLALNQLVQGFENADTERAQNPFTAEQLGVYLVTDIGTYYRQRAASLTQLSALLHDIYSSHPGRYLVALPSYEYLGQLESALTATSGEKITSLPISSQRRGSSADALDLLVSNFGSYGGLLLVVMGGGLSESIDFLAARLDGVIAIGIGLPPPSLARDKQVVHFDQRGEQGFGQMIAYTQPALTKILQTAGRLIRAPEDRGILCLVDPRFPKVKQFFPAHWQVKDVRAKEVKQHVREFWSKQSGSRPA